MNETTSDIMMRLASHMARATGRKKRIIAPAQGALHFVCNYGLSREVPVKARGEVD